MLSWLYNHDSIELALELICDQSVQGEKRWKEWMRKKKRGWWITSNLYLLATYHTGLTVYTINIDFRKKLQCWWLVRITITRFYFKWIYSILERCLKAYYALDVLINVKSIIRTYPWWTDNHSSPVSQSHIIIIF